MKRVLLAALAALGLAACGSPAAPPRVPSTTPAAATDAPVAEPDGVVVLDPGTGPRRALRYQVADGTTRHATYHARTTSADSPPTDLDATWTYAFDGAGDDMILTVTLGASEPSEPADVSGTWRLSARGKHALAAPATAGRMMYRETQSEHMLPIVPAAAVGVGARWTSPIEIGMGATQAPLPGVTTWTLVSRSATAVVVHGTLDMPATDVPVGEGSVAMRGHGTVDARVDLTTFTATTTMRLALAVADEGATTTADFAIDLTIE